jgi:hypothetical protein
MGGRHWYDRVLPGAPKGSLMTLLSPPQCHAALGTIPHALALVDQSPVCYPKTLPPITRMPRVGFWRRTKLSTLCLITRLQNKIIIIKIADKSLKQCGKIYRCGNDSNKSELHLQRIKSRLNLGNVCYHAVQNVFFSFLLSGNINIKIF